ncbi:MAG TPA: hypothetical protein PKX78_00195 [Candidatus Woesebacteria bacterium]|nr:hypothetical protein [Candidatus Woesebacteria bacterium]
MTEQPTNLDQLKLTCAKSEENIVNPEDVSKLVDEICDFYHFPQQMRRKGKRGRVLRVAGDVFANMQLEFYRRIGVIPKEFDPNITQLGGIIAGISKDEFRQKQIEAVNAFLDRKADIGCGVYIPDNDGKYTIYLNQEKIKSLDDEMMIIKHELYHAMTDGGHGNKSGFMKADGKYHDLNEAVIQTLNLCEVYRGLSFEDLTIAVFNKKIETPYYSSVIGLMVILSRASSAGKNELDAAQKLADFLIQGDPIFMYGMLVSQMSVSDRNQLKYPLSILLN